jgi:hypothetical protein
MDGVTAAGESDAEGDDARGEDDAEEAGDGVATKLGLALISGSGRGWESGTVIVSSYEAFFQ